MRDIMSNWVGKIPMRPTLGGIPSRRGGPRCCGIILHDDSTGSPAENIRLAETITDERSRGWAVGMTTMRWMTEDREAATNYIQNSI